MNIENWMQEYCRRMKITFGDRICFIGLQGSRARAEAHDQSDIDVVCILDHLQMEDIHSYREALKDIEHRELVCGFLSGRTELEHWETSELFQFYHDTLPFVGNLDMLLEHIDDESVIRAVRIGAGNIYHGCVHNMVHARNTQVLIELYKAAAFVLRAVCYRKHRRYIRSSAELMGLLDGREKEILITSRFLKSGGEVDFDAMSETLLLWAQSILA